jgi:hypothetical protein
MGQPTVTGGWFNGSERRIFEPQIPNGEFGRGAVTERWLNGEIVNPKANPNRPYRYLDPDLRDSV